MKDLQQCRLEIDEIDKQLMVLFEKRMQIAKDVVKYKIAHDMEIFQSDREAEVIQKNVSRINQDDLKGYAKLFLTSMMNISKTYQSTFLSYNENIDFPIPQKENIVVGFQGVPGSFSEKALNSYFGKETQRQHYVHFKDVFEALKKDEIDYGIVPLENSSTGAINDNYDAMRDYDFYIVGEQSVSVSQHLLGIKGSHLEDIQEVYSHPQGLLQTSLFLEKHHIHPHEYENTAMAAKYVAGLNDPHIGAIASVQAAKLYGLDILQENIQNISHNSTRFIVFGKRLEVSQAASCISIVFTLPHQIGALYQITKIINDYAINMLRIESRPLLETPWEYYFYVDLEGSLKNPSLIKALQDIKAHTQTMRVLGNYEKK